MRRINNQRGMQFCADFVQDPTISNKRELNMLDLAGLALQDRRKDNSFAFFLGDGVLVDISCFAKPDKTLE